MSWLSDPIGSIQDVVRNPVKGILGTPLNIITGGLVGPGGAIDPWGSKNFGGSGGMNPFTMMPIPVGQEKYYDEYGRPKLPEYTSINDPATGLPKQQYQTQDVLDMRGINAARDEALRTPGSMSKWRELAQADESNRLAQAQQGQLSQARNQLAMSGGLRSGAGERLANQSMQSGLAARQNLGSQMAMQDETNRQKWLSLLPGMEQNVANYKTGIQDTNIGRGLQDISGQRAWDMGRYNEGMRAWAAAQTANAMPQSQDKGLIGNIFDSIF